MRSLIAGLLIYCSLNSDVNTFLLFVCAIVVCVSVTLPILVICIHKLHFLKSQMLF